MSKIITRLSHEGITAPLHGDAKRWDLRMPKSGRMNVYGTALSVPRIFTGERRRRNDPRMPAISALVAGKQSIRLLDTISGRSTPIALHRVGRRGKVCSAG